MRRLRAEQLLQHCDKVRRRRLCSRLSAICFADILYTKQFQHNPFACGHAISKTSSPHAFAFDIDLVQQRTCIPTDTPVFCAVLIIVEFLQPEQRFHTVLSDMCPDTSGTAAADVPRSLELASHAARLALSNASQLSESMHEGTTDQPAVLSETQEALRQGEEQLLVW